MHAFLTPSILHPYVFNKVLIKDFRLTALAVAFLLAASVLPILILTSRAVISILGSRDDLEHRFDHVFFGVRSETLTSISVGTRLCPTKQFQLDA